MGYRLITYDNDTCTESVGVEVCDIKELKDFVERHRDFNPHHSYEIVKVIHVFENDN